MLGGATCRTEMDHEPINEIDNVYKKHVEFCLPWTYFRDFVPGSWSISVRHAPPPQSENQTGREATGRAPRPTLNQLGFQVGDPTAIRYPSAIHRRFDIQVG